MNVLELTHFPRRKQTKHLGSFQSDAWIKVPLDQTHTPPLPTVTRAKVCKLESNG